MRAMFRFSLLLLLPLIATRAMALPAPMSNDDLMEKSAFVGVVRVLSVTCTALTPDKETGEDLPHYLAKLEIVDVKKGDVKPGETVLVTWRAIPRGIVGPWAVNYYPGEEVMTHLTKADGDVAYKTTWWNAKGKNLKEPESTKLPMMPGETFMPQKSAKPGQDVPL